MMLDLGLNTVRLEGKMEHPELYSIADELGLMVFPGWESCDKWEAWDYNTNLPEPIPIWNGSDYATAQAGMTHEAAVLQTHPSVMGFLLGSDFWPNDKATAIYLDELKKLDWGLAVIPSAANHTSKVLGPSGMRMDGPYDWVPSIYWYSAQPSDQSHLGAAFGLSTELGAGVGTPVLSSLRKFLSPSELSDLWKAPNKNLFHMSTPNDESPFRNRSLYNKALWNRYGAPISLEDYVSRSQVMDYEATRAQFEACGAMWSAARPATGVVYWMLNAAWPNLHWALWNSYLQSGGTYYGVKAATRTQHVVYDYVQKDVYLVNRSRDRKGRRSVGVEILNLEGELVYNGSFSVGSTPNSSRKICSLAKVAVTDVVFLRLVLKDEESAILSRNVYWISKHVDSLAWKDSEWPYTPVTQYANLTALDTLPTVEVDVLVAWETRHHAQIGLPDLDEHNATAVKVMFENRSPSTVAFFMSWNLLDQEGGDIAPLAWSDNYVTLWPCEKMQVTARPLEGKTWPGALKPARLVVEGRNVKARVLEVR